jgi:hypothetical protein
MKKVILLTILLLTPLMIGWTVSWDRVNTYTDGSTIFDDNVVYDVYQNGVQIGSGLTDNSLLLSVQRGSTYTYIARTRTIRQGTVSDNSAPFVWTWVAGKAGAPGQLRVAP